MLAGHMTVYRGQNFLTALICLGVIHDIIIIIIARTMLDAAHIQLTNLFSQC